MKCLCLAFLCIGCAGAAGAAVESVAPPKPLVPGAPATVPAVRHATFAAASAPFARRMAPGQREEWRFLKDAAAAGRFEHDAARLALAKSADPALRSLAAALVNHQSGSLATLQQLLHARNMAPPMLSNGQRRALNRLAKVHGTKFDREWMEFVALRSQQESLQAFERAAATAQDEQLRSWIVRTLPTLRYQLANAGRVVSGGTKFAVLTPLVQHAVFKAPVLPAPAPVPATQAMGAAPAVARDTADLGQGNMVLGPPANEAAKVTAAYSR
jgi:predicted outer membrane protein